MKINNIKALDYQHQGNTLVLAFADTSMEEIREMDATTVRIETDDGTTVEILTDYALRSVTYDLNTDTYTAILERGVTDTAAAALKAIRERLEAAQGHITTLQQEKQETDGKLEELAGEIKNVEPSVGNAALESTVYLNRILLGNAVKAGSLTPTQVMACDALVEPWAPGVFEAGDVRADGGQIWRCAQGHDSTNNPGWSPVNSRALWVPYHTTDPAKARPYIAPTMAEDTYNKGECMIWTDETVRRALRDGITHGPDVLPDAWELVPDFGTEEPEAPNLTEEASNTVSILDGMTVVQLKEYADNQGVDLGGATKKADIRAAIEAAEAGKETV